MLLVPKWNAACRGLGTLLPCMFGPNLPHELQEKHMQTYKKTHIHTYIHTCIYLYTNLERQRENREKEREHEREREREEKKKREREGEIDNEPSKHNRNEGKWRPDWPFNGCQGLPYIQDVGQLHVEKKVAAGMNGNEGTCMNYTCGLLCVRIQT